MLLKKNTELISFWIGKRKIITKQFKNNLD